MIMCKHDNRTGKLNPPQNTALFASASMQFKTNQENTHKPPLALFFLIKFSIHFLNELLTSLFVDDDISGAVEVESGDEKLGKTGICTLTVGEDAPPSCLNLFGLIAE